MIKTIASAEQMEALGSEIIQSISAPACIYLRGDLGAGKTTFVRGALRGLGHEGYVKSPTFTLVESYTLSGIEFHHFDLYRISDPEELEFIGLDEFYHDKSLCFFEWPDLGRPLIPKPNIEIDIQYKLPHSRQITIEFLTP